MSKRPWCVSAVRCPTRIDDRRASAQGVQLEMQHLAIKPLPKDLFTDFVVLNFQPLAFLVDDSGAVALQIILIADDTAVGFRRRHDIPESVVLEPADPTQGIGNRDQVERCVIFVALQGAARSCLRLGSIHRAVGIFRLAPAGVYIRDDVIKFVKGLLKKRALVVKTKTPAV